MAAPAAQLQVGRTVHLRQTPFRRRFSYPVVMLETDIDRLGEANRLARLFSIDRFNAVAFHTADQGERRRSADLRSWAESQLRAAGIAPPAGLRLLSFPRVIGFGFSPISVWLAFDEDEALSGVIYEVHNTFGEAHAYVAGLRPGEPVGGAEKAFHVSPFFDVSGRYRFTLRRSPERFELVVENMHDGAREHLASLLLRPRRLSDLSLIWRVICLPFAGLGVIFAIHWEALFIWLRGAGYRDKPVQRSSRTSLVAPERTDAAGSGSKETS